MNIGQLKTAITDYIQITFRPTSEPDNDAAIVAKYDALALDALNEARKRAERLHDFLHLEERVQLTLVPNSGGLLSSALKYVPGGSPSGGVDSKIVKGGWLLTDDGFLTDPFDVLSSDRLWQSQNEIERAEFTDYQTPRATHVFRNGDVIYTQPQNTENLDIVLEVNKWADEYTVDGDEDWFTKHAEGYMRLAGIVELNDLAQTFVPRQEGSLNPPTTKRDQALQEIINLDAYARESGRLLDT